jgi:preprotein translocase subunit SecB
MTKKYKVLGKYIKDMSSETPNIETYLFVRDNLSKYQLGIDITSNPLKNKHIEVNTTLKFEDKDQSKLKSHFEIIFATIIKVDKDLEDKKELEKIILCDVQNEVYSFFEKSLLDLLHNSGYPGIKFEKKVDFDSLYKQKFN